MSETERRFPWPRMMQLGLDVLRLSPAEFWAATPREIAAAFPQPSLSAAPARQDFEDLMNRYPDKP